MKKIISCFITVFLMMCGANATTVVATVNGTPITDTDITARTKLMSRQGHSSSDNRRVALQNIIDDNVKLTYAANFHAVPDDTIVKKQLQMMNMTDLSASEREMARNAIRAEMAWQSVVAHTIMPMIDVSKEQINTEKQELAAEHGLPLEMTIIRLVNIPAVVATRLTKPKDCDDAMQIAEKLGGAPQRLTAMQYELSEDVRARIAKLPLLTWSPVQDNTVLLVCSSKKTAEYGKLDEIIKQNATYKQAMFMADQQLKQLRRRAVIVINDSRYKL